MRRFAFALAFASLAAVGAVPPVAAQVEPDRDRLLDRDPAATCRAAHAVGPTAACPRHVRRRDGGIELLGPIVFAYGKATLRRTSLAALDEVAAVMAAHPDERYRIEGHYRDEPDRALVMSRRRAQEVYDYLVQVGGVAAARLEAVGRGEDVPIAPPGDRRNWRIAIVSVP